jgi:hypothetical protein
MHAFIHAYIHTYMHAPAGHVPVKLPENATPGQKLQATTPNGITFSFLVPPNGLPGATILVKIPEVKPDENIATQKRSHASTSGHNSDGENGTPAARSAQQSDGDGYRGAPLVFDGAPTAPLMPEEDAKVLASVQSGKPMPIETQNTGWNPLGVDIEDVLDHNKVDLELD